MSLRKTRQPGRNEPCPCGSGKKFKKCHGGIDAPPVPHPAKIDMQLRKVDPKNQCLSPTAMHGECEGGVIGAHTVSRSGSLGEITVDSHVYSYAPSLQRLSLANGRIEPKLVGWKIASTFPGFCGHHDKQLFSPLEDVAFIGSQHQCFLLAYRSIAWEYYAKLRASSHVPYQAALVASKSREAQAFLAEISYMNDLGLSDVRKYKSEYDKILIDQDWSKSHGLLIEFDSIFPIQCSAAWSPGIDVHGRHLQKLDDSAQSPQTAAIVSFAANGKSYFLLSWLDSSQDVASKLADSIQALPLEDVPSTLASLLILTTENCHYSPMWYDGLSADGKKWVQKLFHPALLVKPAPAFAGGAAFISGISVSNVKRF